MAMNDPRISNPASRISMVLPNGKSSCKISIPIPKKDPARKISKNFVSVLFLLNMNKPNRSVHAKKMRKCPSLSYMNSFEWPSFDGGSIVTIRVAIVAKINRILMSFLFFRQKRITLSIISNVPGQKFYDGQNRQIF